MATNYLSDDEVFGSSNYLSEDEVFGASSGSALLPDDVVQEQAPAPTAPEKTGFVDSFKRTIGEMGGAASRMLPGTPMGTAGAAIEASLAPKSRAPEPTKPTPARPEPTPYKDRREALDDAVNLLEEGAPQSSVAEAFAKGGIKFEEIAAHGQKRGSEYFKQQAAPALSADQQRSIPAPTGEIKNLRSDENIPGVDVAIAGAKGVVGGFKMMMNAGGAGKKATSYADKALVTADQYLESLRSAAAEKDDEKISQIMDSAKDGAWTEQVAAAAKAFGVSPAAMVAQGLGTSVPVILTMMLPGVRESTITRLAAGVTLGAAQGAGATKDSIYNAVRDDMLSAGVPKIEAEERAVAAQSYLGKNKDQIAIGMALGALASSTGVEKIIPIGQVSKVLAKSGASRILAAAEQNAAGRFVVGGLAEAAPEFLQGSAEQVAQNVALQREGRDVPTFQGAVGQGTLEGLAGFGAGGVINTAFGRPATAQEQAARALSDALEGGQFANVDGGATGLLDPNRYDPSLVDPRSTARQFGDVGPSAPISFTPAGSPTQQAGLVDIVVPFLPEPINVGTTGQPSLATSTGGQPAGDQFVGGVDLSGLTVNDASQQRGGSAGPTGVNVQPSVAVPSAAGQSAAGLNRPFARSTDQDLLARTEASIATQENNNAVVPVEQWFGRKGDGYVTQVDAQQALPGRQRMFPDLDWKVEQMPGDKFRLAGYSTTKETTLGNQAPEFFQGSATATQTQATSTKAPAVTGTAAARPAATGVKPGAGSLQADGVAAPVQITGQQFVATPALRQTADVVTFAPGQMGAVNTTQRALLSNDFTRQDLADGSAVFTRVAQETTNANQDSQAQQKPAASTRQSDFSLPQGALSDVEIARLADNPTAPAARIAGQIGLNRYAARTGALVAKLGAPTDDAETTVNVLGALFGEATGIGPSAVAYSEPGGGNGVALGQIAFINTAPDVDISVPRTMFHELKHVVEQIAKADTQAGRTKTPAQEFVAQIDSIFDDITDDGKRSYIENFLHKEELDAIQDPKAREALLQKLMQAPTTRSEMTADFLGNRSQDRAFLVNLARKDPKGFEGFVQKWLAVVDNLLSKLRGSKLQGRKESAKVDQYVRDLEKAKAVARDALIAFRQGNLDEQNKQDQLVDTGTVSPSLRQPDFTDPEARTAVSTAQPTAKPDRKTGYQPDSYNEKRVIDGKDIQASENHVKAVVAALRKYNTLSGEGNATQVMKELHDVVVENLLWLHDRVDPKVRERAKLWYDGANRIANDWSGKFKINSRQTSGILAVFSPQMDWFKNVSLAERAVVIMTRHADESWSKGMTNWAESWVAASDTVATKQARQGDLSAMNRISEAGKKLKDMNNEDAAYFVRAFDEAYLPRTYRLVTPEGGFDGFVANDNGSLASVTWGGFGTIEKAVSIFRDGSFRNVDQQLGGEHKVRNFYNNIIDPNNADGHVTIDTHAVAAAFLKALSGTSVEVMHNLGGLGSTAATGASGSYALFADAYRDAASQRGVLAREMQSITWEAVRALFPAELKSGMSNSIEAVWDRVKSADLTRDEARNEIIKIAGGMRAFAWEGGGPGVFAADGATSFETAVANAPNEREVRTMAPKDAKDKITVSLSAATNAIPGIRKLYELAQGKDTAAHALLQDIAFDSLQHLLSSTSARIQMDPATGLYGGASEPSLSLTVSFSDNERDKVLAALERFAQNFNQEQVHVRQGTKSKVGTKFDDGSYVTPVYRWELSKALDRKQIQNIINKSGLYGLTFGDTFVEAYYVGDTSNEESVKQFYENSGRADGILGAAGAGLSRQLARLWPYGYGDGAIGYDRIRGDISPREAVTSRTAKRVAEYLKGAKVKVFEQASDITDQQASLQKEIARVYESLPDNDLKNPRVRKAYSELAKEVVRQFNALPIKVEVMTGQGEPYTSSAAMRRDILDNNHLFIFGTTPEAFGPPGADFTGHPLLEDTGIKDQNGYQLLANDLLRAVHDYYAHAMAPTQFGPKGEEAAWKNHMSMTSSPWARWALTAETRGQNSWVNFRPLAGGVPINEREFARQKAVLLPIKYAMTGDRTVDATMRELKKSLPEVAAKGSKPVKDVDDAPLFSRRQSNDRRSNRVAPETAEFKKFFADSKVVDADGEPMVVYHGTYVREKDGKEVMGNITAFDRMISVNVVRRPASIDTVGNWFSTNPGEAGAEMYGNTIYPVYLSIKNPQITTFELMLRRARLLENGKDDGRMVGQAEVDAYRKWLTSIGKDGIKIEGNSGDNSTEFDGQDAWITLEPEQIKSATGNDGSFDSTSPDIRLSKRQKLIGTNFEVEATGIFDAMRVKLQDDALRMKRVIEAVKGKGGKVGEAQNFYDANTLMPGRIQAAVDDFKDKIVRPLLDKAAEYGIDMDELSMFSYAMHARERNAYIASVNKRLPDGGSGMTDAEAFSILQMVDITGDTAKFDELHRMLMAITSTTRQVMLAEGLITQDEFTALESAYDNYIPLRGFEDVDAETGVARKGVGRGVNIRGAETVRAMGRKSKAGDLIENVISDYERVVSRVEKNDVGKVLLDFVLSNPDPDLWGVDVERSKPGFNKATGTVQYTKSIDKGEDTVGVKVGGQQVYIKFADKELTRALRQAWKDETSGLERATLAMTGWWNNWMRAVLTKYNPAFALINIPRDALWSGTASALADLGPKGLARYLAVYPKAFMASTRKEAGVSGTTNKLFGNPQMDARFAEFRSAGGITGGFYMRSLSDINQDLRNDLLLAGSAARNPWESVKALPPFKLARLTLRVLEFMGSASENATRFALYQASRDQGRSPAQSAILAKDGTTNFNRKGEWGGSLNNLYLFFNAAVQGNAQLFKVLKSPAVQASMAGVAGVGMMLALYGAASGGEDDDGEAYWDKIPGYVKERNMVIMLPPGDALAGGIERVGKRGRYITIPVQYGFNIFPNMGYTIADVLRNQADPKRGMTLAKAGLHMTSTVFGSVNPFGGAVNFSDGVQVLLAAMPTLVDLPIQIINERGTFGTSSSPQKSPFDRRPDSERMFTSQQDSVSAKIAKVLNELGGGNEAKAGSLLGMETSVAPGTVQTLISATTGGLGTFIEQVGTAVMAMTGDDKDLKANKIPFLNRFYGEVDEGANIRSAGDRMREVRALSDVVKAQQKLGLDPELTDEEERLMRLSTMQETYQRQSTMIRKRELEIIKDKSLTDAEKTLERKRLQVDRDKLSTDMNREYLKAVPK